MAKVATIKNEETPARSLHEIWHMIAHWRFEIRQARRRECSLTQARLPLPPHPTCCTDRTEAEGPPDALDLAGIRGIPLDALAVLLRFLLQPVLGITGGGFFVGFRDGAGAFLSHDSMSGGS